MISISLATRVNLIPDETYFCDVLNYKAYLVMKKNIVLCTSVGNNGCELYTLSGGLSPWIIILDFVILEAGLLQIGRAHV